MGLACVEGEANRTDDLAYYPVDQALAQFLVVLKSPVVGLANRLFAGSQD